MINKKSIIVLIIIVVAVTIIFIGYYPPFFPFLKYGPFSKPITKEVFSIDSFPYSPDDPQFFVEVKKIVKKKWYDDAKLGLIFAYPVSSQNIEDYSYAMYFFSDSHPLNNKYINKYIEDPKEKSSELEIFYNAESYLTKSSFRSFYSILPERIVKFLDRYFRDTFDFKLYIKVHTDRMVSNERLTAIGCIDSFICWFKNHGIKSDINPMDVRISAGKAYEIASTIYPDFLGYFMLAQFSYQDKETGDIIESEFPYWFGAGLKINAVTGEIFER